MQIAGKAFKDLGPLKLCSHAVSTLIEREDIDPAAVEALVYGVMLPEPGKPNLIYLNKEALVEHPKMVN